MLHFCEKPKDKKNVCVGNVVDDQAHNEDPPMKKIKKNLEKVDAKYTLYGWIPCLQYWVFEAAVQFGQKFASYVGEASPRMLSWTNTSSPTSFMIIEEEQHSKLDVLPCLLPRASEMAYVLANGLQDIVAAVPSTHDTGMSTTNVSIPIDGIGRQITNIDEMKRDINYMKRTQAQLVVDAPPCTLDSGVSTTTAPIPTDDMCSHINDIDELKKDMNFMKTSQAQLIDIVTSQNALLKEMNAKLGDKVICICQSSSQLLKLHTKIAGERNQCHQAEHADVHDVETYNMVDHHKSVVPNLDFQDPLFTNGQMTMSATLDAKNDVISAPLSSQQGAAKRSGSPVSFLNPSPVSSQRSDLETDVPKSNVVSTTVLASSVLG